MKTIKIAIFSLLATLMFAGCSLDETNIRVPVADVYYKTEEGAKMLINSAYSYSRYFYGSKHGWRFNTMGTDLWINGGDGQTIYGMYTFTPSGDAFQAVWDNFYLGIAACNTLLDRAGDIDASENVVNDLRGQALFLRAMYYHTLAMHFGDVPLQLREINTPVTTATRTPVAEVYAQVINDLLEAEKLLNEVQADFGRATKYAAQALLARVYLWTENNAKATEYAKKVIDSNQFELLPNYSDLWEFDGQKNKEIIWAVVYTQDLKLNNGDGNQAQALFGGRYDNNIPGTLRDIYYGRPFRNFMPSRYFLDLASDNLWWDSRFDKSFRTVWLVNNPDESKYLPDMHFGDTALWVPPYVVSDEVKERMKNKYTIYDINEYFVASSPDGEEKFGKGELYPSLIKWNDHTRPVVSAVNGSTDFAVLRLAEKYLNAAEALMKDGKADEGVTYFNKVRERAAWTPELYEQAKLKNAGELTIDVILTERALELNGEMHRWPDLKRTGKLLERVKAYNYEGRPNIAEKHLLRPIPTTMLDRVSNKEEFKQNTGY